MIIAATIILGAIALLMARFAGLTGTWIGTGSITAVITFLVILAVPSAHFLFDSAWGFGVAALCWLVATSFYHRLLTDNCRQSPIIVGQRAAIAVQWGRHYMAFAVGVSA